MRIGKKNLKGILILSADWEFCSRKPPGGAARSFSGLNVVDEKKQLFYFMINEPRRRERNNN